MWLESVQPSWRPSSESTVQMFQFASAAPTRDEQLWDFLHCLASCGIYVDPLYTPDGEIASDTVPHAYGDHGQHVAAVRVNKGATINWWINSTGQVRLDGRPRRIEATASLLRKYFKPYDGKNPEHSQNDSGSTEF